jgi:uncharacterized protein (TIGR03435 family)
MKPNSQNLDEILDRYLPSAPGSEVESDGDRVWSRLRLRMEGIEEGPARGMATVPGRAPIMRPRKLAIGAAAAVLLLAVIVISPFRQQTELRPGETLRFDSATTLALTDGSRVEVRAKSQLSLERADDGLRIHLQQGGIIVNAAKQKAGRHLYVRTKDVTVSVVGTVFLVNAEDEGSRVAVIEGEIRVKQGEIEKSLRPGQQVLTEHVMTWQPVSEEISWSGSRETHLALLRQATRPTASAEPKERFDVVSIRPVAASADVGGRGQGGGGNANRGRLGGQPCSYASEPRIDPVRLEALNATAVQLIAWAFGLKCLPFSPDRGPDFLFGGPDWARQDGYHVVAARPEGPSDYTTVALDPSRSAEVPGPKLQRMLQTMLAERFKLEIHREMRETQVYVLSTLPDGPKFTAVLAPPIMTDMNGKPIDAPPVVNGVPQLGRVMPNPNNPRPEFSIWTPGDTRDRNGKGATEIHLRHKTMTDFTQALSFIVGRPVLDRTNLTGDYNFFFQFRPVECATCPFTAAMAASSREGPDEGPTDSLFDLFKKVGLELKASRENVEVWVIDRVERPTDN